jgi:hypothetical protein
MDVNLILVVYIGLLLLLLASGLLGSRNCDILDFVPNIDNEAYI